MSKYFDYFMMGLLGVAVLVLGWASIALLYWAMDSPSDNYFRCRSLGKSQGKEYSTTGWRSDTCYLYKDGTEEVIKL